MPMIVGERVRAAREDLGISQAEMARRLGSSKNAMNMLELGQVCNPRASRVIGLARLLRVTTDYLLGMDTTEEGEHA